MLNYRIAKRLNVDGEKSEVMKEINREKAERICELQHKFFQTGKTKDAAFRIRQLKRLKTGIKKYEAQILEALKQDLGKHESEGFMTEVGFVYKSIQENVRNLKQWMQPEPRKTPYYMQPGKSYVVSEPYGSVLIIGPFNYPFQLVIEPLIGAIAAGNCAVLKLSELTPTVSHVIAVLLKEVFPRYYVWCVEGGIPTTTALLEVEFDYIFFTGSPVVGKIVMKAAAEHMTPVTLELGGKSPVIVDETADVKTAARRILWGKTVNVGQTCVAPDYIYVHKKVKKRLIQELERASRRYFGTNSYESKSYGRIVNERHFQRLNMILESEKEHILYGGNTIPQERFMELTLVDVQSRDQACMQEEIFGPILPILTYENLDDVIREINDQPKPLALYVFSRRTRTQTKILRATTSGGACINDVISHVANPYLPFGGVGNSGIGSYHGKESFYTFSHRKSVFDNRGSISSILSAPPYNKLQLALVKKVFH